MDSNEYVRRVAIYYMCDINLASKIIKRAELNGSKRDLDRIIEKEGAERNENFNNEKISK